ncbi:MaoC family dehydratase [Janthinobacterium agaricidamnosum]|uniref:MaoC family dehydratase n=1 Tax=Janthinobacterium agaricidamnosum TaxID=55508 RepID=UPI00057027C8|nr:MaoC family dehydratase [Janthinobacterium agaricidamnosum]
MRDLSSLEDLHSLVGQHVAYSDWVTITQKHIDDFAETSGDRQWIHVDAERCQRESPFGSTIAHGFLTLSLVSAMLENAVRLPAARVTLNYGLNKVRFPAPVPVDSRLRASLAILSYEVIDKGVQLGWKVVIERDGGDKPVCVAQFLMHFYP